MNKKDQSELQKDWSLAALATFVGFLINISATATYDLYVSGFEIKKLVILGVTGTLSIFIVGFFMYLFENLNKLRNQENSLLGLIWEYTKSIFRKKKRISVNVQGSMKTFHELMIIILKRRSLFRLFENSLKNKAEKENVENNAFAAYYVTDYTRGQLIDLRKFFETDHSSYKISDLVYYIDSITLRKKHQNLFKKWKTQFESGVNKVIAHLDKDSGNVPKEITKHSLDDFIDVVNNFLNGIVEGVRTKGALTLNNSLRDTNGELLNTKQETEFEQFKEWFCNKNSISESDLGG